MSVWNWLESSTQQNQNNFYWFNFQSTEIKKLGGSPITLGGDDLDCNFIAMLGYPEPLKTKDIQKIIDDAPYVEKILAAGKKKSYMAQIGYLERQGFNDCFPGKAYYKSEHYGRRPHIP